MKYHVRTMLGSSNNTYEVKYFSHTLTGLDFPNYLDHYKFNCGVCRNQLRTDGPSFRISNGINIDFCCSEICAEMFILQHI